MATALYKEIRLRLTMWRKFQLTITAHSETLANATCSASSAQFGVTTPASRYACCSARAAAESCTISVTGRSCSKIAQTGSGAPRSSCSTRPGTTSWNCPLRTYSKNAWLAIANSSSCVPPNTDVSAYTRIFFISRSLEQATPIEPTHQTNRSPWLYQIAFASDASVEPVAWLASTISHGRRPLLSRPAG